MAGKRRFFFNGGVQVKIEGMDRERFFNIAVQRNFAVYDMEEQGGVVRFWTTPSDLKAMKPVLKKTGVRIRIEKRYGIPFFLLKNRKRKLLAAGIAAFFLILYVTTWYVWDISFEGNYRFTNEMLLHYMETLPVTYGMRKSEISCEQLEGELRNHFSEITWVSAELRGTRLIIRIRENEIPLKQQEKKTDACDLAAAKEGKIVKTVVRSGILQVKEGDIVEDGTVLIDGTIPIYDDSETLVNSHEVHADGEIYAETVYHFRKKIPLLKQVRFYTGKKRNGFFVRILDAWIYLMLPGNSEVRWEYVTEEYQAKVLQNYYLPVYLGILKARAYETYEAAYTEKEAFLICRQSMREYMEKLSEKGVQILESDGRIEKGESGWSFYGSIRAVEDIAEEIPIPEKQEEIQTVNECD